LKEYLIYAASSGMMVNHGRCFAKPWENQIAMLFLNKSKIPWKPLKSNGITLKMKRKTGMNIAIYL